MTLYLGLDVHGKATVYAAMDGEGRVVKRGSVETAPEGLARLLAETQAPAGTVVGLETGTQATWVARLLTAAGDLRLDRLRPAGGGPAAARDPLAAAA
jgi:hypothetical protein